MLEQRGTVMLHSWISFGQGERGDNRHVGLGVETKKSALIWGSGRGIDHNALWGVVTRFAGFGAARLAMTIGLFGRTYRTTDE